MNHSPPNKLDLDLKPNLLGVNDNNQGKIPLVVDLDGTLSPSDSICEGLWWALKHKPFETIKILPQLLQGRSKFKRAMLEIVPPQVIVDLLPWNQSIVKYLEEQNKGGRKIVLATASDIKIAEKVKERFPFLSEVIGSTPEKNLKGKEKAAELVNRYGEKGFDYIGNDEPDLHVWEASNQTLLASSLNNARLGRKLIKNKPPSVVFPLKQRRFAIVLKALRIKQWTKNLLVYAPMVASHSYLEPEKWIATTWAFLAFSLCASGAYLLNDLLDLEHDRKHHKKYLRPIAQGLFPIPLALLLATLLPAAGLSIGLATGIGGYILLYLVATILYSLWLKQIAIVDIATLAGLYCLRIITGGIASNDPVSFWMASFGGFLFVSLAAIKRQAELLNLSSQNWENDEKQSKDAKGRDYNVKDIELTRNIGVATGCIAPLVLALYLEGNSGEQFYAHPEYLWGACGLIFIWIMSLWRDTEQLKLKDEDPISYSLTNKKSLILLALTAITLILATCIP
jgi:4-hydroxybenzoate polyprenyltransferase